MRIAGEDIGFRIGPHVLLDGVTLDVPDGSMVGLVGANGSGKSTSLRLLYRALKPQTSTAWLDEMPLWKLDQRRAAQLLGAVPQDQPGEFDLTANDLVQLGPLPHQHMLAHTSLKDEQIVAEALELTGVTHLRHRSLNALSGGERQRAIVARALAKQPQVLLLDEPTNSLDVRYQHELLQLLRDLRLTSLIALHDLNLAAAYCDHAIVLCSGSVVASGPVLDVLVPEVIEQAFGIGASLIEHPVSGRRHIAFHPLPKEKHEENYLRRQHEQSSTSFDRPACGVRASSHRSLQRRQLFGYVTNDCGNIGSWPNRDSGSCTDSRTDGGTPPSSD